MRGLRDQYEGKKLRFWKSSAENSELFSKFRTDSRPHFCFFVKKDIVETVSGVNAPLLKQ